MFHANNTEDVRFDSMFITEWAASSVPGVMDVEIIEKQ
jgi:hypothetical protein